MKNKFFAMLLLVSPLTAVAVSADLSTGFDSLYVFRGEKFQDYSLWGQGEVGHELNEHFSFGLAAWYLQAVEGRYTELDVTPSATVTYNNWELVLAWAHYNYMNGADGEGLHPFNENEIQATISYNFVEELGVYFLYAYNLKREGQYGEIGANAAYPVLEGLSLKSNIALGFGSEYFYSNGMSHFAANLGAEYSLTEKWSASIYGQLTTPLEALEDDQDTYIYWGASTKYSF